VSEDSLVGSVLSVN